MNGMTTVENKKRNWRELFHKIFLQDEPLSPDDLTDIFESADMIGICHLASADLRICHLASSICSDLRNCHITSGDRYSRLMSSCLL